MKGVVFVGVGERKDLGAWVESECRVFRINMGDDRTIVVGR